MRTITRSLARLLVLGGLVGGAVRVRVQLGEVDLDIAGELGEATGALTDRGRRYGPTDQHTFRHRLQLQVEIERRALLNGNQLGPDPHGTRHRLLVCQERTRSPAESQDVDHQRRSGTSAPFRPSPPSRFRMRRHASILRRGQTTPRRSASTVTHGRQRVA